MPEPEGQINSQPYPIGINEQGQTLWHTVRVAEEKDEVWPDWSAGLGETTRQTGRGYFFSNGFDATANGVLHLSPHYQNLNNTALTTAYGYFAEGVETTGSTLTYDAASTGKGSVANLATLSWSHTVASQDERILIVSVATDDPSPTPYWGWDGTYYVVYKGQNMRLLAGVNGTTNVDANVAYFYLLDPPTGANNVVVLNWSGSTRAIVGGAVSFYGVNADEPFGSAVGGTNTDATPTVTVSTSVGEFVVAAVALDTNDALTAGTNETERWDGAQSTDVTSAGYTQAGTDGGVMAPSIDGAATDWVGLAVSVKPASTTSRTTMFVGDTTKIFKYTLDSQTGLTLDDTETVASGEAGRPAMMNAKWYFPLGSGANAVRLDDATTPTWTDAGWKADHLANYQKLVQPTLARVNSTTKNTVELNADTSGDVGDTWTNETQAVGDSTTNCTGLVESQGQLFVPKEDTLYDFGSEGESRNTIPFLHRGKDNPDNGKGTTAFGDMILYPSKGNLWRYRIAIGALPIGANTIKSWRKISAILTPKDGRHTFPVCVEGYWYDLLNEGQISYLLQGKPEGNEVTWHSVLTIPLSKGLGVDSRKRLWIKGASSDQAARDIRVIQLAEDGSLDVEDRKGQASTAHDIYFDERNFGRPQDTAQLRHFTVETEGDWDATTSLQPKIWRNDGTSAESVGDPITSAGLTTNKWTVGTNDQARRGRPHLTLTTNSSYAPKSSDPAILRAIVGIRFPEIIRIVVPADDALLQNYGMTATDAEQNLRRLQNQGVVAFLRPGQLTTFNAEVTQVTDVMYQNTEGNYCHGIELMATRWITS